MAGRLPEHTIARPMLHMRWGHVSFVHWAYDPAVLEPLMPAGLTIETFQGQAWVGLVPFVMAGVRPAGLPAVRWISTFPEFNVRTYVRDGAGRDGLLFLTLEAAQPLALLARPAIGIAYTWACMRVSHRGGDVGYASRRRWPRDPAARLRLVVTVGDPIADEDRTPLDDWLTGRWRALSRRGGLLLATPVTTSPGRCTAPPCPCPTPVWSRPAAARRRGHRPLRARRHRAPRRPARGPTFPGRHRHPSHPWLVRLSPTFSPACWRKTRGNHDGTGTQAPPCEMNHKGLLVWGSPSRR